MFNIRFFSRICKFAHIFALKITFVETLFIVCSYAHRSTFSNKISLTSPLPKLNYFPRISIVLLANLHCIRLLKKRKRTIAKMETLL